MKKNTIAKRKLHEDCWNLDYNFYKWLYDHLKVYLHDANQIVDLEYWKFNWQENEYTQLEMIKMLLHKLDILLVMDSWDKAYQPLANEILDMWKLIIHAMWW